MTDDDLDVRSALDLLARRADGHAVGDRLPAVRRRARRTAQVRTAALAAAAVVLVGVAGTLVQDGRLRGSGPAVTPTVGTPGLEVEVSPETNPTILAAAGAGPYGDNGFRLVLLVVHVRGTVPGARDGSAPYGLRYDDGLASSGGSTTPECAPGAPLVAVDKEEILTLTYPAETALPSAPVMITVSACAPVAPVVRRLTVQIPDSGTAASDVTPAG